MADTDGINVSFENYPPSTNEIKLIPITLGTGPVRLMVEIDEDEDDPSNISISVVTSNGPEHDEVEEFLDDMIELLELIKPAIASGITDKLDELKSED